MVCFPREVAAAVDRLGLEVAAQLVEDRRRVEDQTSLSDQESMAIVVERKEQMALFDLVASDSVPSGSGKRSSSSTDPMEWLLVEDQW